MSNNDKKRDNALIFNAVLFSLAMFFGLFSMPSFAAEVENAQIGTVTISGTSQSIAITPVTDNKSILIFTLTTQSTASGPQDTHVRGQLSCIVGICDSIDFRRYGSGDSVIIRWQVVEFTDASLVNVQRGIETQSSMAGSPPSKTISTGVNSAKSFVMLSEFVHGSVTSNDDFTRGQIDSSGNLVITVGEMKTLATQAEIAWQVVEYQDANIQTGDISFSTSDASKTIGISTVDLDKSLLVYNHYSTGTSSDNPVCQNLVSGLISDATTLQFDRGCAGHNGEIHLSWFAIEFTDASTVQHEKQAFTSTELSKTVTLTNVVDTSCAVITTSGNQRGGQSPATVDHTSSAWFNAGLNAAGDEITLTRGQTNGVTAETGWSVVEFAGCGSTAVPHPNSFSCAANVSFSGLDKNLLYSAAGQDFHSHITYAGASGNNVWNVNVKGSAAFDPISRDTRTTNGSGDTYQNPEWPNADGIWFKDVFPGEQIDYQFAYTRVSGSDPLNLYMHTGESLDDERDTLTTNGSDWIVGRFGNMSEAPNLSGKTAIFEDNGLAKGVDTGVGYWEAHTSFSGNSGLVTWNYAYLYSTSDGTNMIAFEVVQDCSIPSSNISGVVFKDANANDVFDSGESGLANISVWLQAINTDGSIDPVMIPANTDALGNYQISSLADGDYQVHVDSSDTDLPSDHIMGASNPLIININDSDISDANFPFDEVVCEPFVGEVSEVSIPLAGQLKTTDKLFVPSRDVATSTGHLKAYAVDDGSLSWDASTLMDSTNRTAGLYSSDSGGKIKSIDSLTEISETIRQYTFDAPLGSVSRGNDLDLLTQKIDISLYLTDTDYRDYYTNKVATRDQLVLMSSDDGFLYAFDYSSGALVWAWMPRSLITELTGTDSYQAKHLMAGSVDILDLPDSSGKYDTYVVGAYKKGLGHYVLKLKDDGSLDKIIWDDDQSSTFTESPNNGEMEFFRDDTGVYATYVLADTGSANTSQLKIRSLVDDITDISVNLSYQATSTPFVMPDYDKRNAPSNHTLYLGNLTGEIHKAVVLNSSGSLERNETTIKNELEGSSVTTMDNAPSDAVLYIDASVSSSDNQYYLSSQSATRLTLHRYKSSDSSWNQAWTSYVSGAASWETGSKVQDSSGVPADKGGFAIIPPDGIQSLPTDATITARATIVGDNVVLPLTVLASSAAACYGKAYFYLYRLSDGKFPKQSIFKNDGTEIVENIPLGYGEASQLSITDLAGTNKLLGYGVADKDLDLNSGIATSFNIKDLFTTGVRGWKEIGH